MFTSPINPFETASTQPGALTTQISAAPDDDLFPIDALQTKPADTPPDLSVSPIKNAPPPRDSVQQVDFPAQTEPTTVTPPINPDVSLLSLTDADIESTYIYRSSATQPLDELVKLYGDHSYATGINTSLGKYPNIWLNANSGLANIYQFCGDHTVRQAAGTTITLRGHSFSSSDRFSVFQLSSVYSNTGVIVARGIWAIHFVTAQQPARIFVQHVGQLKSNNLFKAFPFTEDILALLGPLEFADYASLPLPYTIIFTFTEWKGKHLLYQIGRAHV